MLGAVRTTGWHGVGIWFMRSRLSSPDDEEEEADVDVARRTISVAVGDHASVIAEAVKEVFTCHGMQATGIFTGVGMTLTLGRPSKNTGF